MKLSESDDEIIQLVNTLQLDPNRIIVNRIPLPGIILSVKTASDGQTIQIDYSSGLIKTIRKSQ